MLQILLNKYQKRCDDALDRWAEACNAVTKDVVETDFNGSEKLPELKVAEQAARDELKRCEGAINALTELLNLSEAQSA